MNGYNSDIFNIAQLADKVQFNHHVHVQGFCEGVGFYKTMNYQPQKYIYNKKTLQCISNARLR